MRLNQITLPTTNVARGRDFYVKLGFKLIVDSPPHYVRLEAPVGGATLSLGLQDDAPRGHYPAVYLETDTLDADVARLKAAGIVFDSDPVDQTWLWREAWLRDPDGNALCLYHAGENRLAPPWKVG